MSKIIKYDLSDRELANIVQTSDGMFYYVDSCYTMDAGYETMAFVCDDREHDFEVLSWTDRCCRRYPSVEDMIAGHKEICENLEKYLALSMTAQDCRYSIFE